MLTNAHSIQQQSSLYACHARYTAITHGTCVPAKSFDKKSQPTLFFPAKFDRRGPTRTLSFPFVWHLTETHIKQEHRRASATLDMRARLPQQARTESSGNFDKIGHASGEQNSATWIPKRLQTPFSHSIGSCHERTSILQFILGQAARFSVLLRRSRTRSCMWVDRKLQSPPSLGKNWLHRHVPKETSLSDAAQLHPTDHCSLVLLRWLLCSLFSRIGSILNRVRRSKLSDGE